MKKIVIQFIKWLRQLFKRKPKEDIKPDLHKRTYTSTFKKSSDLYSLMKMKLGHSNNRKRTRGRHNQYIDIGNGITRLIRH